MHENISLLFLFFFSNQVESLDGSGNVVKGPYAVTIYVEDINDNPPEFDQTRYFGVVRQNSRPGNYHHN